MTADDPNLTHKERQLGEIRSDIESTREKLAQTLDAIEDKLNVPAQAKVYLGKAQDTFEKIRKDNPMAVYVATGAAAVVAGGLIIWRIARR